MNQNDTNPFVVAGSPAGRSSLMAHSSGHAAVSSPEHCSQRASERDPFPQWLSSNNKSCNKSPSTFREQKRPTRDLAHERCLFVNFLNLGENILTRKKQPSKIKCRALRSDLDWFALMYLFDSEGKRVVQIFVKRPSNSSMSDKAFVMISCEERSLLPPGSSDPHQSSDGGHCAPCCFYRKTTVK